jgi:hypothetical protein
MVYDSDGSDTTKKPYVAVAGYGSSYNKVYVITPDLKANSFSTAPSGNDPIYTTSPTKSYSVSGSGSSGNNQAYTVRVKSKVDSVVRIEYAVATKTAGSNKSYVVTRDAKAYSINRDDELVYTIDPRHLDEQEFTRMEKQFADNGFKLKINNHHNDKLNIQISGSKDNSTSSASASISGDDLRNATCYIRITGDKNTGLVSISTYPTGK